jgi:hypothetical protein
MSRKPKKWGSWPTIQPGGPVRPARDESYFKTRPRGPKRPTSGAMPPTKGPTPPPKRKSGCGTLAVLLVLLAIGILYVKMHH